MTDLLDKHGGFRKLHSFTLATIVQLETRRFCQRFLTYDRRKAADGFYDPQGRQYDQMIQAARSGRQNIMEGSQRAATSKETEMKLTDVARASLTELRGDYEIFIMDQNQDPWSINRDEAKAIHAVSLDKPSFIRDTVHESSRHIRRQREKYAKWLDDDDAVVVANAMHIIIGRAVYMLQKQIEAQGEIFERTGGFRERLTTKRVETRHQREQTEAPECPDCGQPMRRRKSTKGEFWGCSTYPDCRGTRPV